MKAIVYSRYGQPDVLQHKELEKPVPDPDQVLVKVYAASINYGDWGLLRGKPFLLRLDSGLLSPKNQVLGGDIAGRVEAIGSQVKQFQPGDDVFGDLSGFGRGGFAEYVAVPEEVLAHKPNNLSYAESAAVPMAGVTALQGLRDIGKIQPGYSVLVNGASGGVGSFAVQIAKSFGAEVTAVCSTKNLGVARSIGADQVIDYSKEDFTKNGQAYDLILAVNGYHPISDYRHALSPDGIYVCSGGSLAQIFQAMIFGPWMSSAGGKKLTNLSQRSNQADLVFMKELLESGRVVPVIDQVYPLSEVPRALRYFGGGHAQGKVVITVTQ
ncbi:MAG: NAD(P)-dependent alcohol dehydrogenase [Anaerolineales bacterium]